MKDEIKEWADVLLKSGLILILMYVLFWPFKIDGSSMEKNFFNNDRIAVSRIISYMNRLDYEDCIVCEISDRGKKEKIIKRIIGRPLDTIRIENGLVYRNGEQLTEPYISTMTSGQLEITLNENEYFVMGDNRGYSFDSRNVGPVSKDKIIGKVIAKWYPFSDIKFY